MGIIDNSIVAMLDILGFSSLLCEVELEKVKKYMIAIERLTDVNSDGVKSIGKITYPSSGEEGSIIGGDSENKLVEYKFAFDTMIYYTLKAEERDFYNIIITTAKLLAYSYFSFGLPLRGAISYGEVYVDEKNIFGRSLIDAHKYESMQEWSGCILSPELIKKFENTRIFKEMCSDRLLLGYKVPVKDRAQDCKISIKNEKFYTINWMQYGGKDCSSDEFRKQWSSLREKGHKLDKEVNIKLDNTEKFREYSLGIDINNIRNYEIGRKIGGIY